MAKTVDMRLNKAAVKYDIAVTERPSSADRKEALAEADIIIEEEGATVEVNRNAASQIDVTYLPSLHSIFSNTYTIIDSEMRHLARCSSGTGLDNLQSRHFGVLTRSLCQLAQLEMGIKEQSNYESIPDEDLEDIVLKALERKGRSKGSK